MLIGENAVLWCNETYRYDVQILLRSWYSQQGRRSEIGLPVCSSTWQHRWHRRHRI